MTQEELEKQEEKVTEYFDGLQIPTNPQYDFESREEQPDYVNPVMLSNKLVQFANAVLDATKHVVILGRRRERLRLERKDFERSLVEMRRQVLSRHPAPPSAAKNLQLTDAYVIRCLESEGTIQTWKDIEAKIAKLEDEMEGLEKEEENLKYAQHTIRIASENITNKLAYVKAEAKFGVLGA